LSATAGYFETPKPDTTNGPVKSADQKTLLNLLWWLNYTKDGRDFLKANRVINKDPSIVANTFKDKLAEYGITDPVLVSAITDAHFAANRYVNTIQSPPGAAREAALEIQEKIYQQNMSFICWKLWEDVQDHEFSMNW